MSSGSVLLPAASGGGLPLSGGTLTGDLDFVADTVTIDMDSAGAAADTSSLQTLNVGLLQLQYNADAQSANVNAGGNALGDGENNLVIQANLGVCVNAGVYAGLPVGAGFGGPAATIAGLWTTTDDVTGSTSAAALLASTMTTSQRLAILNPISGMVVLDTTLNSLAYYSNRNWYVLTGTLG